MRSLRDGALGLGAATLGLLGLLAGCSDGPAPVALRPLPASASPLPRDAASAALDPSASAALTASLPSAPSAQPPQPDPVVPPTTLPAFDPAIVKKLGPKGVALLEIAASVCAPAVAPGKGGALIVGCRSCPPFTAESGPDGTVRVDEKPERGELYELELATFGSFTEPGVDEVAATFSGCESHAENYGGTLLARRTSNSKVWVARSYRSGFHPEACMPFALPDKRDLLLCKWSTQHQLFESELFDSYDFALPEDDAKGWQHIFAVGDDALGSCTNGVDPGHYVVSGSIDRFSLVPGKGGASASIQLDVSFGSLIPGLEFKRMCDLVTESLDAGRPLTVEMRNAVTRKKHKLRVIWDGQGFALDAASAAAWAAVQPAQPPAP